jgi:hypothetical protein
MLGGALKKSGLTQRQLVFRGKCVDIGKPHGVVAVKTAMRLIARRLYTNAGKLVAHSESPVNRKPARPTEHMRGTARQDRRWHCIQAHEALDGGILLQDVHDRNLRPNEIS